MAIDEISRQFYVTIGLIIAWPMPMDIISIDWFQLIDKFSDYRFSLIAFSGFTESGRLAHFQVSRDSLYKAGVTYKIKM